MSKGLEALLELIKKDIEDGINHNYIDVDFADELLRLLKPIEAELKEKEKQDEILRIIKEKEVDIRLFMSCIKTPIIDIKNQKECPYLQLEMYNNAVVDNVSFVRDYRRCLSESEFDLLKEWFK